MARAVVLKYTPTLRFVLDDSVVRGNRVLQIIEELEKDSPGRATDRDRAMTVHCDENVIPKSLIASSKPFANSQTICIVGHVRPDGDCVGSQLGLTLALQARRQESRLLERRCRSRRNIASSIPTACFKSPSAARSSTASSPRIAPASNGSARSASASANRKLLINIDHHESNTRYGDLNWVSAARTFHRRTDFSPAQSRALADHQADRRLPVHRRLHRHRLVSICHHAARHLSRRRRTGHAAARTSRKICDEVYQSYPLSRARLLKHVYSKFRLTHHNQIAYFWLKKADFARTGADSNDTEGLIDHIRAIEPVVVACVFEEIEPELTRISLRSKSDKVNVNEIAASSAAAAIRRPPGRALPASPFPFNAR